VRLGGGEEKFLRAKSLELLRDVAHIPRGKELAFLDVHDPARLRRGGHDARSSVAQEAMSERNAS